MKHCRIDGAAPDIELVMTGRLSPPYVSYTIIYIIVFEITFIMEIHPDVTVWSS